MPPITEADDPQIFRLLEQCKAMLPPPASAPVESPILDRYRRWIALDAVNIADLSEEAERDYWRERDALEDEIAELHPETAADFAAKMLVAHCMGIFNLAANAPVWLEAYALVGVAVPKWMANHEPV